MIARIFVLSFLLIAASDVRSQTRAKNPEPMQPEWAEHTSSATPGELYELSKSYIDVDNDLALCYAKEGYRKASSSGDSTFMVRNGLLIGSVYRRTERLDAAMNMYEYIVPIAERNGYEDELMIGLNSSGITLSLMGLYDKALDRYYKTLEMRKHLGDTSSQIIALSNIAIVYYKLKNYEKALEMFITCRELQKSYGQVYEADLLLLNTAHAYAYLGRYEEALLSAEAGLRLCGESCSEMVLMSGDFVKGLIHMKTNRLEEAEEAFLNSYSLAKKAKNPRMELDNLDYLSQMSLESKDFDKAARYLKNAEQLVDKYPLLNLERIKIYYGLSMLYRELKDFRMASDYQLKYMDGRDSLYSEEMTNDLMRLEAEHVEKENQSKIDSQKESLALSQELLERQRLVNKLAVLLIGISSAFVLILLRDYRRKKRMNRLLEMKVEQRTHELSFHREKLLVSLTEKDLLFDRMRTNHSDLIHRMKGLCSTALKEVKDPVAREYLSMVNSCAQTPEDCVKRSADAS